MTGPGLLDDLTTQLTDFMGLAADLDLPHLAAVCLDRHRDEPGWTATAQLCGGTDRQTWSAVCAWAAATGGTIKLGDPSPSIVKPSGRFREVAVTVSTAGLTVTVWGHVDSLFEPDLPTPGPEHGERRDERMRSVA